MRCCSSSVRVDPSCGPDYGVGHHSAGEANSALAVAGSALVRNAKKIEALDKVFYSKQKRGQEGQSRAPSTRFALRFEENQADPHGIGLTYSVEYTGEVMERTSRAQGKGASLIEQTGRPSAHESYSSPASDNPFLDRNSLAAQRISVSHW